MNMKILRNENRNKIVSIMKSLLILLPNNLLDYLIEYDDTYNLINL